MKKTLLFLFMFVFGLAIFTANSQTVIYFEDFQSGSLPTGWTQETLATDGGWLVGDATAMSSAYFPIPAHTIFACTKAHWRRVVGDLIYKIEPCSFTYCSIFGKICSV